MGRVFWARDIRLEGRKKAGKDEGRSERDGRSFTAIAHYWGRLGNLAGQKHCHSLRVVVPQREKSCHSAISPPSDTSTYSLLGGLPRVPRESTNGWFDSHSPHSALACSSHLVPVVAGGWEAMQEDDDVRAADCTRRIWGENRTPVRYTIIPKRPLK